MILASSVVGTATVRNGGVSGPGDAPQPTADAGLQQRIQLEKLQADLLKTQAEIAKTREEADNLREIGPGLNKVVTLFASLGGIAGAILGAAAALWVARLGSRITKNFNEVQSIKLRQDRELGLERHNLDLYQSLGNANARAQFAAAAVLLQRLGQLFEDSDPKDREQADRDVSTIIHVLISILKEQTDEPNSAVLRKHIADNMVKAVNLICWDGHPDKEQAPSFLHRFDLQKCKLRDVFWRGVNLRFVDLYGADLSRASLRNADLRDAVLYEAVLAGCVLRNAMLQGANLESARIEFADFSGANLTGAILKKSILRSTTFSKTRLDGADLSAAQISGVDFSEASMVRVSLLNSRFDDQTKWPPGFDPIDFGAARFDDLKSDPASIEDNVLREA